MNQTLTEHHIAQCITKLSMLDNLEIYQLYSFIMYFVKINSIYFSHGRQYKIAPTTIEHCIAELNQTPQQMNQALTKHNIA